jgi:GAF domain-containing protein
MDMAARGAEGTGSGGGSVEDVVRLSQVAQWPSVEAAVDAVLDLLGVEVACATEMTAAEQHLRVLRGDGKSFSVREGWALPLDTTLCQRVLDGRLPSINPDVRADPRAASVPATVAGDLGAFVSVPMRFSNGRLFGTLCAASHAAKPGLSYRELRFLHVYARIIADQFEREATGEQARLLEVRTAAARTLVAAVRSRDRYTGEHSRDVVEHAVAVARRLGLTEAQIFEVELVSLLHDIGKIAIPDAILRKRGALTNEEWEIMREHPIEAELLVRRTTGLEHLALMVRGEHERWDGNGYPDGLAGEAIPLASRITLACDAYHAMTSDRPYRRAMAPAQARAELEANSGTQFDPEVVAELLAASGSSAAAG